MSNPIEGEILRYDTVTMSECLPDNLDFMDDYQAAAVSKIQHDSDNSGRIRGKLPVAYMYDGLVEELEEVTGEDRTEPDYSRFRALVVYEGHRPNLETQTHTAVERQLKEFGDISWYLANYLNLFDIPFSGVVEPGKVAWHLDNISQRGLSEEFSLQIEREFPWTKFLSYASQLPKAAASVTRFLDGHMVKKERDLRGLDEQQLVIASGKFVVGAIHILRARFGVTYESVLAGNQEKILRRVREGTVFDKSGGDDR